MREAIRVRHYSLRTEEAYLQWVRRFILFNGKRHPENMGEPEVAAFLTHRCKPARLGRMKRVPKQRGQSMPSVGATVT